MSSDSVLAPYFSLVRYNPLAMHVILGTYHPLLLFQYGFILGHLVKHIPMFGEASCIGSLPKLLYFYLDLSSYYFDSLVMMTSFNTIFHFIMVIMGYIAIISNPIHIILKQALVIVCASIIVFFPKRFI